jgi:tetratricopeptide (TPR) repeat protein
MLTRLYSLGAAATLLTACAGDPLARHEQEVAQDPRAMLRIADTAQSFGNTEAAAAFYRRAADLQPGSTAAYIGIARSLAEQGKLDQAIETLQSAKSRNPTDPQLSATLGRLLVAANRPDDGLAAFDEGLQHDPQSPPLLVGRGVALDAMGQHEEAQDSYRKAIVYDPRNAAAQKDLALSLALGEHQVEAAAAHLK